MRIEFEENRLHVWGLNRYIADVDELIVENLHTYNYMIKERCTMEFRDWILKRLHNITRAKKLITVIKTVVAAFVDYKPLLDKLEEQEQFRQKFPAECKVFEDQLSIWNEALSSAQGKDLRLD